MNNFNVKKNQVLWEKNRNTKKLKKNWKNLSLPNILKIFVGRMNEQRE